MLGLAAALAGTALSFAVLPSAPTQAASTNATFTVPSEDGYGVGECVSAGAACGQGVADAGCEAQGYARSVSFGVGDMVETTASTGAPGPKRPISITCAE